MCSHREYFARRRFQTTLQCGAWAAFMTGGGSRQPPSSTRDLVIVERCGGHLGSSGQVDPLRDAGEVHLLAEELVGAVLARDFDDDEVRARLHELAVLILAVPLECIAAR